MRFNRVIPFWQHSMRRQIDLSLLLRCNFHPGCIIRTIELSAATKTALGFGRPNELQHCLIADKKLPGPILTDETKHPMFNRIPLGCPCRQMSDRDLEIKLIGQLLQAKLPQPTAVAIATSTVSFNQQPSSLRIGVAPFAQPPATDRRDHKFRSLMRHANHDKAARHTQHHRCRKGWRYRQRRSGSRIPARPVALAARCARPA